MITELLTLAADQNQIVGIRIQPGIDRSFHVHIWVGPRLGERAEWFSEFSAGTDQMAAIDQVAASAIAYCRRPVGSDKTAGAFTWGSRATADESMSAL